MLPPDWVKDAVIYEVNLRQYTPEGTFNAFEDHIPRLKNLGVKILWLMPVFPSGKKNQKGIMGSPYAVKDYLTVNPEMGTLEDFKKLIYKIHDMGMFVIMDWVANHTAWDHHWTQVHPEWYNLNEEGGFKPPSGTDWFDVIELNYKNQELRRDMIDSMSYWIKETKIDGFRFDMAKLVPLEFWEKVKDEVNKIKNLFLLGEAEGPEFHKVFDMTYNWSLHHIMNEVAQGKKEGSAIINYYKRFLKLYNRDNIVMNFTSNHDENSWQGTVFERLGDAHKLMAVLTYTVPGMPLVYGGQEAGLDKRLKFFEKDEIIWGDHPLTDFYKKLNALKKDYRVFHNGAEGGDMNIIDNPAGSSVFIFTRKIEDDQALVILNLSPEIQNVELEILPLQYPLEELFSGELFDPEKHSLKLNGWEFRIYENQNNRSR